MSDRSDGFSFHDLDILGPVVISLVYVIRTISRRFVYAR